LLALTLPVALVLLFPDGRLPSRRWRPVLWGTYVIFAGAAAQLLHDGTAIGGGMTNALEDAGVSYPNPLGVLPRHGWFGGFLAAIFALAVVTAVLAVASVFVRRHGASAERRQQLAWLGYVGVLTRRMVRAGSRLRLDGRRPVRHRAAGPGRARVHHLAGPRQEARADHR